MVRSTRSFGLAACAALILLVSTAAVQADPKQPSYGTMDVPSVGQSDVRKNVVKPGNRGGLPGGYTAGGRPQPNSPMVNRGGTMTCSPNASDPACGDAPVKVLEAFCDHLGGGMNSNPDGTVTCTVENM